MYIAITARPDIATAVSVAGQFAHNPGMDHWKAVLRVLKYLKGTKPMTLTLGGNQDKVQLTAYSDADWAANLDTRRSRSGLVVMINDSPVMWKSKLQNSTALSSTDAEYIALSLAFREELWARNLLNELKFIKTIICFVVVIV